MSLQWHKKHARTSTKPCHCESACFPTLFDAFTQRSPLLRYQCATDGSSVAVSVAMAISLYATARIFLYLSITRIAYIVFLWITLRPLARKYFSTQIDLVTGVVTRFINAIISSPTGATQHNTAVQEQPASKKEM